MDEQEGLFYGAHLVCLFSLVALHQLDIISTAGCGGSRKGSNTRERERVPVKECNTDYHLARSYAYYHHQ
jgi:hypothetical protein